MKKPHLSPLFAALSGLALLGATQIAVAGKIISQAEGIEAEKIEYIAKGAKGSAEIRLTGCTDCPKTFPVDATTRFFAGKEVATPKRIGQLSGKPGTVIYDPQTQRVVRVRW